MTFENCALQADADRPVLALHVVHQHAPGPGEQGRDHLPHALARPGRRDAGHVLEPVVFEEPPIGQAPKHDAVGIQEACRPAFLRTRPPRGPVRGRDAGLARHPHGVAHDDDDALRSAPPR